MATKRLFVGNLPYSATDGDLREKFGAFGVSDVHIVEGRGFAFVEIDASKLDEAVEMSNGSKIGDRVLSVNEARPRERSGNSGGGGGGYESRGGSHSRGGGRTPNRW